MANQVLLMTYKDSVATTLSANPYNVSPDVKTTRWLRCGLGIFSFLSSAAVSVAVESAETSWKETHAQHLKQQSKHLYDKPRTIIKIHRHTLIILIFNSFFLLLCFVTVGTFFFFTKWKWFYVSPNNRCYHLGMTWNWPIRGIFKKWHRDKSVTSLKKWSAREMVLTPWEANW
jgi:hypothetical protein